MSVSETHEDESPSAGGAGVRLPPALEYAERPPRARRWVVRSVVLLAVVVAGIGAYRWRHEMANWASLVWLRHRALRYELAPGPVMRQLPSDEQTTWGGTTAARYAAADATWDEVDWRLIPRLRATPGSSVTLFLHERVSPAGHRRVVAVHLSPAWAPEGTRLRVDVRLFEPGTWRHPRFRELSVKAAGDLRVSGSIPGFPGVLCELATVPWGSDFCLFPGRADANDPARFTIGYVRDGVAGMFVGRLNDDDSISVKGGAE